MSEWLEDADLVLGRLQNYIGLKAELPSHERLAPSECIDELERLSRELVQEILTEQEFDELGKAVEMKQDKIEPFLHTWQKQHELGPLAPEDPEYSSLNAEVGDAVRLAMDCQTFFGNVLREVDLNEAERDEILNLQEDSKVIVWMSSVMRDKLRAMKAEEDHGH